MFNIETSPVGGIQVRITTASSKIMLFAAGQEDEAFKLARGMMGDGDYIIYALGITDEQLKAKANQDARNIAALSRKD